jgi:hypothetical protein
MSQQRSGAGSYILRTISGVNLSKCVVLIDGISSHHECHFEPVTGLVCLCLRDVSWRESNAQLAYLLLEGLDDLIKFLAPSRHRHIPACILLNLTVLLQN